MTTSLQQNSTNQRGIALYLRTATSEGSLRAQQRRLKQVVRSRNRPADYGKIVACFSDSARSGLDSERPGLKALLEAVQKKQASIVLVTDVTRLSRSVTQLIEIFSIMALHDCRLETEMGHLPLGKFIEFHQERRLP